MFFDPLEIPDELLEAQEQGELVVFAGAGVSMGTPSDLPDFKQLAKEVARGHPLASQLSSYEQRLDRFFGALHRGKVDVQRLCRERLSLSTSKPTDLHRWIVDLFAKPEDVRIVTTNFDDHFGSVLRERSWTPDIYCAPALPLGNDFSGLVHLHGWLKRREPFVLTDEDFGRAYLTEGWAREFLQRLFAKFTTLFIGYSHNDIPVEYIARGMSAKSMAPRYALTASGEAGLWASLGITEITFHKTAGTNAYQNLYSGMAKWADFSKQQPTDIAERVKNILCLPDSFVPDKSQSTLLVRCLARETSSHFFTQHARGWRWISWLDEQKLLVPLFEAGRRELPLLQRQLARWLAEQILQLQSDDGLLLVERHSGVLGRELWDALCWRLRVEESIDWTQPIVQRWVLLLIEICPRESLPHLSTLLTKAARYAPDTLGLIMLRRLTCPRIVLMKRMDFFSIAETAEGITYKDEAGFELAISGESDAIEEAWESVFKKRLDSLAEPLLLLFDGCLREASELYRTFTKSAGDYDSFCSRGRIYERDTYRSGRDKSVLLDCLLNLVEHESESSGVDLLRIQSWLASHVPVLTRVALYALHLNKALTASTKVRVLLDRGLVHPAVHGATHEAWQILVSSYVDLNSDERSAVWRAISDGPQTVRPDNVKPEQWEESRQWQINRLTWFLASKCKECPAAQKALEDLKHRAPDFKGHVGIDQVVFGEATVTEGLPSPRDKADLLKKRPEEQIDWLVAYRDTDGPFGATRDGLLLAVGAAVAQNQDWGVSLLKSLGSRDEWESDLWSAAFSGLSLAKLSSADLYWLLQSLEQHFGEAPSLRSVSFFLFHSVDFSDGKRPPPEIISLMCRVSLLIWRQLKQEEPRVNEGFKDQEWSRHSLNHPAGHIAEFWLKFLDYELRTRGADGTSFPEWLKEPLGDIVAGADYASQLGRVTLARHLPFVYHVDPSWTAANLFPKFEFSTLGDEAFLMWEPHAGYGDLSRDLIMVMPAIYRAAFRHFQNVDTRLQAGFYRHIAAIVYSCLIDVNQGNWLAEFLVGLTDEQRSNWALQFGNAIEHAPKARRTQIWETWMKPYWRDRLAGRPCELLRKEAEEILHWAFDMGDAFPEAVELVIQGPRLGDQFGTVEYLIEKHASAEKFPEAVLRLLNWLLDREERQFVSKDIETLVFSLPKRRAFVPQLDVLCQNLARLGYAGASQLKGKIAQKFILE